MLQDGRRREYRDELRRFKSFVTLKIEAISSCETSILTRATRHKVLEDIFQSYPLLTSHPRETPLPSPSPD
jgi:hypothetical protein